MATNAVKLLVAESKVITQEISLRSPGKVANRVKAAHHANLILADAETGIAPKNVTVRRAGDDLELFLEGSNTPDLIVEGYYGEDGSGQLVGLAEDGSYHAYVVANGEAEPVLGILVDGVDTPATLGRDTLSSFADGLTAANHSHLWIIGAGAVLASLFLGHHDAKAAPPPPPAPKIMLADDDAGSEIARDGLTNDAQPTFSGVGEPGAMVVLREGDTVMGSAMVDANGRWTIPMSAELSEGSHSLTAIQVDALGQSSPVSSSYTVVVDTVAQPPLIENAVDAVGTTEDIASGGLTNDPRPTFSGTGEPGAIVTLRDGTTVLGSAVVGPDGGWTISPIVDLTDGRHSLVATQVDPAGNVSGGSTPYVVNVDLVAQPPLIENAVDAVGTTEDIASGGLTNDPRPTFSGTGEPGAIVTLRDGTTVLGSAVVGPDGGWTISPIVDLTDGRHSLVATQVDPAGNVSGGSTPYVVNVDLVAQPPLIENAVDAVGTTEDIASGGLTNDPRPTFSGTGEPGAIVTLRDGTTVLGSAVVGPDGGWAISPIVDLTDGRHSLVATQVDPAGNVSGGSTPYVVNVDLVAQPPLIENAVDAVGTTEDIASGGLTNDPRPTFSGTGEPGAIVTLRDGTTVLGSAVVGPDGGWTISPIVDLTDGRHSLVATQVDPAGNVSGGSTPYVVNVDLVAQPPLIENAVDAVGTTEDIASGGLTNDPRPTFSGTGEPGAIVTLRDGTTVLGSAVVGPDGGWTISPIVDLTDGRHSLVATQVDPAGNVSGGSTPYVVNVDLVAQPPLIENAVDAVGTTEDIASGGLTNDPRPTFSGTGEPGAIVTLRDGTTVLGSAVVGPDGGWTISPIVDLTDGHHSLVATQVDPAGNVSGGSTPYVVNVDLVAQPPLIENAVDAVGTTEDIASGGLTNDPRPTFSGTGEPGAIVTLRDGTTVLGSAVVGPDGGWTISPIVDLADGRHSLVATQVDPAGNASAASAPYVLNVDVTAPASASIDSMGRDSGSDNNDFLTNDGSPGRLIQGTLSAALLAGEKVQVSVDGGNTWTDAIVNGDTWSILDGTAHTGDWIIQSRVVDAAGNVSEVVSQAVTLDTVAPNAPAALSFDGTTVTVNFDGGNLVEGDKILVVVGGMRFEQVLTQAQIDAGEVAVTTTAGATLGNTSAAIVDQAGNTSQYLTASSPTTEDFSGVTDDSIYRVGQTLVLDTMSVKVLQGRTNVGAYSDTPFGKGQRLYFGISGASGDRLEVKPTDPVTKMSFTTDYLHNAASYSFYDTNGVLLQTLNFAANAAGYAVSYTAPEGREIGSMIAYTDEWGFMDNFIFTRPTEFSWSEAPVDQVIAAGDTGMHYGAGDDANNFALSDVAFLNSESNGISAGAGIDTLTLTGANQVLDLDAMAGKIESVEIIDLTGTGNNTLNLSLKDVLEQGSKDLFVTDGKTQMLVKGNAGDVVNLDDLLNGADVGDWSQMAGEVTVGGVAYDVFQHSGLEAELLVQQGVTTNLV